MGIIILLLAYCLYSERRDKQKLQDLLNEKVCLLPEVEDNS